MPSPVFSCQKSFQFIIFSFIYPIIWVAPHKFWHVDYLATFSAKYFLILNIMIYFTTHKLSCCFLMCLFNVCCGCFWVFFVNWFITSLRGQEYIDMMLTSQNLLWDLFCGWADAQPFKIFMFTWRNLFIYLFTYFYYSSFLKCGPWTSSISNSWRVIKMQILLS